ncbi:MAG: hypothetical protein V3R20_00790 [Sphingomonadales bacterium]
MPNLLKSLALALVIGIGGVATTAFAADVEVDFSSYLDEKMGALNRIEQAREERFRKDLDDANNSAVNTARRTNVTRFGNVAWAGETLIPDLNNYTVENLTIALVNETLNRAGMGDVAGTIRLSIDRLRVQNHPLGILTASDSYVIGTLEHVDANGSVLKSTKVSANLVFDRTVDHNYQGPDYAFSATDPFNRVGPALARFVQKGLENLFGDEDFVGPIVIEGS